MHYVLIAAMFAAFIATQRGLGLGLSCVFAVGYFHGIIRSNYVSTYTTFLFDAAVLGMYLALLLRPPTAPSGGPTKIVPWITALILWPLIISAIPQNDTLVQFVAFRATAWFLPILWIGSRITDHDLQTIARSLTALNLLALAFGVAEYILGVPAFYPLNSVTQTIYNSNDIAGGYLRIPSTFLNAHAYGGTMVNTFPFLLGQLLKRRTGGLERLWLLAGLAAAAGGILLCGARQPVLVAGILLLVAWGITGFSPRIGIAMAGFAVLVTFVVAGNERLQRFTNLTETSRIAMRIRGSVNESFFEYVASYPFGAGMGSSVGTSVPYFLSAKAPKQIGLENEYCRILIDQGWIGLLLWGSFLVWLHHRPPKRNSEPLVLLTYALTLTTWATAFVGTGLLASIPGTSLLLVQMGIVAARRNASLAKPTQSPMHRQTTSRPENEVAELRST